MNATATIRFGGFRLNRSRGCLEDAAGVERFLRPKSFLLLEALCERLGELITKDELVQQVWPDVFVSDDSLAQCVSDIRRALGTEGAVLLRTVPRRGYMLLADAAPIGARRPPPAHRWPMLAVALAITFVVAGISLGWTLVPDKSVTEPIGTKQSNPAARVDLLLDDRNWLKRENNEEARILLQAVLDHDPQNADAWASLGLTYWLEVQHLSWGGGRREMAQALDMVENAIALGGSGRSHRLLAEMRLLAPFPEVRSPVDALANARAAVEVDPSDADNLAILAQVLALTGHANEAVEAIEQAHWLNPAAPDWYHEVAGLTYLLSGEPARAAEEFGPLYGSGTFVSARWWSGWLLAASLAHAGRLQDAAAIIRAASARRPEKSIAAVAQSLHGLDDPEARDVILGGLRIAGLPD